MSSSEGPLTLTIHGINFVLNLAGLGLLWKVLRGYGNYVKLRTRLVERMNCLWKDYCKDHEMPFEGIENGNRHNDDD